MPADQHFKPPGSSMKTMRGFSLIEIIITIVVVAIAFTALGVWMVNANRDSANPFIAMRAAELGQAYLDEILAKRFDELDASGGNPRCNETAQPVCSATMGSDAETRANYDDVDDYNGVNDAPPLDALGNARSGYGGFSVQVSVAYAGTDLGLPLQALKRIDVTVQSNNSDSFVFSAYRGNF